MSKTTGGTTISETNRPRIVSRPRHFQFTNPQAAVAANKPVRATDNPATIIVFKNHRGN